MQEGQEEETETEEKVTLAYDGTDFYPHTKICDWCGGDGKARAVHPLFRESLTAIMKILKPVEPKEPIELFNWDSPCFWCQGTGERKG